MLKMKRRVLITEGGARNSLHHPLTCRDKGRAFLVTFRSEDPHFVQCQPYRVLPYQRGLDDIAQSYKDQKASLDKVNLHMDSSKNADTKENGSPVPSNPLLEEKSSCAAAQVAIFEARNHILRGTAAGKIDLGQ